jgi:hypothetical protein
MIAGGGAGDLAQRHLTLENLRGFDPYGFHIRAAPVENLLGAGP